MTKFKNIDFFVYKKVREYWAHFILTCSIFVLLQYNFILLSNDIIMHLNAYSIKSLYYYNLKKNALVNM